MNATASIETLPFPALAARALALCLARPDEARRTLELLDPLEGHRLFLELVRIARGKEPPRLMSRDLRSVLPHLAACGVTLADAPASL